MKAIAATGYDEAVADECHRAIHRVLFLHRQGASQVRFRIALGTAVFIRRDAGGTADSGKVFHWTATMWEGSLNFDTPVLWAVGSIFVNRRLCGLILSVAPINIEWHGTRCVVARFHDGGRSLFAMYPGYSYGSRRRGAG